MMPQNSLKVARGETRRPTKNVPGFGFAQPPVISAHQPLRHVLRYIGAQKWHFFV